MKQKLSIILIFGLGIFIIVKNSDLKKTYLEESDTVGVYINNELSDKIPSKDEAIFYKAICDDENVSVSWDNESWGLLLKNLTKKAKCNLYFYQGDTVFNFDYTGAEQTFVAPVSGTYKLETWGAQGDANWEGSGGFGGYASGITSFDEKIGIFINIGGSGENGGYNGGNPNNVAISRDWYALGGGATHIAFKTNPLSNLKNSLNDILIVSGGGGGAERENGGSGGGYIGGSGYVKNNQDNRFATGGTQFNGGQGIENQNYLAEYEINGLFGKGGNGYSSSDAGPNGGGGFYGGGATTRAGGAGGGSGYIGNPLLKDKVMYCYNCEESNEESTKTISTTCGEETPTENCAKKGNGYARITLVSIGE